MIGHTLSGRYELLARVGGGGMALVYKAKDLLLNRFVAVKVLRQQFTHDEDFVKRFRREAQAAASLSHPNIVSIYDVGQVEDTHYIVMEYIEGANLNEIIRDRAPMQSEEAVRITSQICDALEHAHQNQIIHRDIKPHNILIGNNGRVKVTDFGIARAVTSSTITQTGAVVGSVHYFSPEHAKGVATGEKSDLYSLGIVLYQMVTGRLPFLGESPISVALKHLQEPFEQPRKVNPHIPQSVENIISKAMRKNPQERYHSAREMMKDLETCLQPQRLNEPPSQFASDDDEEAEHTRAIPALRTDMRNTMEAKGIGDRDDEDRWNSDGLVQRKRRWVLPTILGIFAVLLIGVLIWAIAQLQDNLKPKDVMVPTVTNQSLMDARSELEAAGLKVEEPVEEEPSETVPEGYVTKQSKEGIRVKEGSGIALTISTGKELPGMPDLEGKTYNDAVKILKDMGVDEDRIGTIPEYDDSEEGTVLKQSPATDQQFDPENQNVTLTVSQGPETFAMPNLVGKTINQAKQIVADKKLKLPADKIVPEPSYTTPQGTVFKQFPPEGDDMVTAGTEVTVYVSSGYPKDSRTQQLDLLISPAVEGQISTIKIVYSDARGDNREGTTKKISTATSFPVKLVLSPEKDGVVYIYENGQFLQSIPVPYEDRPASNPEPPNPDPGTPGDGTDEGNGGQG
ncbi:Stk1 family PASTA domain-containing Ser/Thr kinase [Cohnella kolymensis]|uniref:Stk1 family PASTA domain-containing Ser/Thr kinase n=1 Tax=Cohnella kolymensis TaxID=1590652 RepID=UPI000695A917|nr:Stk1 family PASTA domain-containing Ser/Thr kinase [Cohnella kolymensis]